MTERTSRGPPLEGESGLEMVDTMPRLVTATVLSRELRPPGFWCVHLECPSIAQRARPAQYVAIDVPGAFAPRLPLGIFSASQCSFSVLFQEWGERTARLAALAKDHLISCIGPLGNHFELPTRGSRATIVAGGLGVAAFWLLARDLRDAGIQTSIVLGARSKDYLVGHTDLKAFDFPVQLCTDDGSLGFHGSVVDYVRTSASTGTLYGCGPQGMLRALCELANDRGLPCQVSMEETFGCSLGTCWGCVVPLRLGCKQGSGYPRWDRERRPFDFARVCRDGTVFSAADVLWRT